MEVVNASHVIQDRIFQTLNIIMLLSHNWDLVRMVLVSIMEDITLRSTQMTCTNLELHHYSMLKKLHPMVILARLQICNQPFIHTLIH